MNTEKEKLIKKEEKRLINFLKNKSIDEDKLNIALDLVKDIAYMTVSTAILKKEVEEFGLTEEYQNGANQRGRKKSASFDAYLNMTKQKAALIKQVTDLLPIDDVECVANNTLKTDELEKFLEFRENKNEPDNRVLQSN